MGKKFDMGQSTLGTLTKQSSGSNSELGTLVRQLIAAAQPLESRFDGAGKAAFDAFKANADGITAALNAGLGSIVGGQAGMDKAFQSGDSEMASTARSSMGSANFDAARFGKR